MARLSGSSKGKETKRISERINSSPKVAETNAPPPTVEAQTTSASNNDVTVSAPQQRVENVFVSQAIIARQDLTAVYVPALSVPPPLSNNTLVHQPPASV